MRLLPTIEGLRCIHVPPGSECTLGRDHPSIGEDSVTGIDDVTVSRQQVSLRCWSAEPREQLLELRVLGQARTRIKRDGETLKLKQGDSQMLYVGDLLLIMVGEAVKSGEDDATSAKPQLRVVARWRVDADADAVQPGVVAEEARALPRAAPSSDVPSGMAVATDALSAAVMRRPALGPLPNAPPQHPTPLPPKHEGGEAPPDAPSASTAAPIPQPAPPEPAPPPQPGPRLEGATGERRALKGRTSTSEPRVSGQGATGDLGLGPAPQYRCARIWIRIHTHAHMHRWPRHLAGTADGRSWRGDGRSVWPLGLSSAPLGPCRRKRG